LVRVAAAEFLVGRLRRWGSSAKFPRVGCDNRSTCSAS
jgi:hypothetical protein